MTQQRLQFDADSDGDTPRYQLFTDGACLGNPGPGGWAYVLKNHDGALVREDSGGEARTTNNRMELMGAIEGLRSLDRSSVVSLCADSQYVVNGINEWLAGWKRRGWRKADKKPVLNADLWKDLDALLQRHEVIAEWTRGHAGHVENERCDQLAFAEAERHRG
ncbi:MAG: ribonuclease HI [Phycisphaera sp.]|nr:ribonuclease HI [Phycisphaera sp.]